MLFADFLAFSNLQGKVEELYKFRDHYFENHSIDDAINRNSDTKNELDAVLVKFKEYEGKGLRWASFTLNNYCFYTSRV